MRALGDPTFCLIDSLPDVGGEAHNLTNQGVLDFLLRLAWSGCINLAAASLPCAPYSKLRELPDAPRPLRTYDDLEPRPDFTLAEREELDLSKLIHERTVAILHGVFVMGRHVSWENPHPPLVLPNPS